MCDKEEVSLALEHEYPRKSLCWETGLGSSSFILDMFGSICPLGTRVEVSERQTEPQVPCPAWKQEVGVGALLNAGVGGLPGARELEEKKGVP